MITFILQAAALLVVAACYASVGLGGGTAYLTVLSFGNTDPGVIRPIAWGLNVLVTAVGFRNFYRKGHFSFAFSWPFLLGGGVGGALGAQIPISAGTFRWILGVTLVAVALRMWIRTSAGDHLREQTKHRLLYLLTGLAVGIVSGVVGIGGGIVLGPIVVSLGWASMKKTAALTSAYIFVSSASALGAHLLGGGGLELERFVVFGILCLAGGYAGSRYGAGKARADRLQRVFSVIVLIAGVRLLLL